jgi:hypothetical protein
MSAEARRNGWNGFDVAQRVHGGYQYDCDGMPTMMGCGAQITVPRKWSRVGLKKSGWFVCFGLDSIDDSKPIDDPTNQVEDHDVVLTFCPSCTAVVRQQ